LAPEGVKFIFGVFSLFILCIALKKICLFTAIKDIKQKKTSDSPKVGKAIS
jgi:hypothetical protein